MSALIPHTATPLARLRSQFWNILQITLLSWMIFVLNRELTEHVRSLQLIWLLEFSILGLAAGWILARSKQSGRTSALILFAIYLAWMLIRIGQLSMSLANLFSGLLASAWGVLFARHDSSFRNIAPLVEATWLEISVPFVRIFSWIAAVFKEGSAFDPLVTAILGSALIFFVAAWAAWAVWRREQPLFAFLPVGILLLFILYVTQFQTSSLVIFIMLALLLHALVSHHSRIRRWEANGTGYAEDIHSEMIWAVGALVMVFTTAAFMTSSLPVEKVLALPLKHPIKRSQQADNLAKSIGIELRPAEANPFGNLRFPGLPRAHLIKAGAQPSEETVMTIQVEGLSPIPDANGNFSVPNFYWRGSTYDVYTGAGWRTSRTELSSFRAGEANPAEPVSNARQVRQEVRLVGELEPDEENIQYAAGTPVNLDQTRQVAMRSAQDVFGVTTQTRRYISTSLVNEAQPVTLRLAGEDYPPWVLARYLELPDSVPDRVRLLAINLTSAAPTPYDRALAIEAYLRTFPYSLDVPAPPPGGEVSDFFLFDLKRGYCDYYATTMVVLSRAAGLPARLVVGYASGTYDPAKDLYQVSAADAHAWVEIFFPGHGWIIFEPTAGRPPIDHLSGSPLPQINFQITPPQLDFNLPPWLDRLSRPVLLIGIILLAGFVLLAGFLIDRWRLLHTSPPATVDALYRRFLHQARCLPFTILPSQTPYEVSAGLADWLSKLIQDHPFKDLLKPALKEISHLVELYIRTIYSPVSPGPDDQRRAVQNWNRLRWRLWLGKWLKRTRRKAV